MSCLYIGPLTTPVICCSERHIQCVMLVKLNFVTTCTVYKPLRSYLHPCSTEGVDWVSTRISYFRIRTSVTRYAVSSGLPTRRFYCHPRALYPSNFGYIVPSRWMVTFARNCDLIASRLSVSSELGGPHKRCGLSTVLFPTLVLISMK